MVEVKKKHWHDGDGMGCGKKQVKFFGIKIFEFEGVKKQRGIYFCFGCGKLLVNVNGRGEDKFFVELNQSESVWPDFFDFKKNLELGFDRDKFISAGMFEGSRK